jgi:hypothetical protein
MVQKMLIDMHVVTRSDTKTTTKLLSQNALLSTLAVPPLKLDGPTVIVQAPKLKSFSGQEDGHIPDAHLWFGSVAQYAFQTRQSLLYTLDQHTTGTAAAWVHLLTRDNNKYETQQRMLSQGILTLNGDSYLQGDKSIPILKPPSDADIAKGFHTTFLAHKPDVIQEARLKIINCQCKQAAHQDLEQYIIAFRTLLSQAEYDGPNEGSTTELDWVQIFRKGLHENLVKHGAFDKKAQHVFTSLLKYWDFLRTKVREAKDLHDIDKDFALQKSSGQVNSVREVEPRKRRHNDSSGGNSDKRPRTRPQADRDRIPWEGPRNDAPAPDEATYTDFGRSHPSMPQLAPGVVLPDRYRITHEPRNPSCQKIWDRIRHTCHSLNPHVHPAVPVHCLQSVRGHDSHERYCVIHGANTHLSMDCPTVAAHFRSPLQNDRHERGNGYGRGRTPRGHDNDEQPAKRQGRGRGKGTNPRH